MKYTKETIKQIQFSGEYYIPEKILKNKMVRTELKWGYAALLNAMLKKTVEDEPYVAIDEPLTIEILKVLANKKVDQAKISGYIDELADLGLVTVEDNKVYIEQL